MTTLVRWDPLRDAAAMHTELSRLMNGLFEGNGRQTQSWVPTLDVWETEDEVVYAFDLPGIPKDKIAIEAEDGALTVTATRERESSIDKGRFHRLERRTGTFSRSVGLPQGVSEDAIKASYDHGVLEVRVPKPEQPKPKRIEISVEGEQPTIEGTSA
ncbi:MAG TPA: Hsp20/alpha crystallin family protein [Gaiellaceae bacterium]|nr:Hsp20/alpha crystallin family protein [Gaiellaceae bacterium]